MSRFGETMHADEEKISETLPNGDVLTGHPIAVKALVAAMKKTAKRNARWPCTSRGEVDTGRAMFALIASFPCLRDYTKRGRGRGASARQEIARERFDTRDFLRWATGAHATGATRHATRFILHVWNPNADYRDLADELGLHREADVLQPFSLSGALGCFDERHTRAMRRWIEAPFWP